MVEEKKRGVGKRYRIGGVGTEGGRERMRKKWRLPSCWQLVSSRKAKLSVTDAGFGTDQLFYTRPFAQPPNSSAPGSVPLSRACPRPPTSGHHGGGEREGVTTKGKRSAHLLRITMTRAR